ncbi:hypothetical protein Tco_0385947 [Tanacetum coccineum]
MAPSKERKERNEFHVNSMKEKLCPANLQKMHVEAEVDVGMQPGFARSPGNKIREFLKSEGKKSHHHSYHDDSGKGAEAEVDLEQSILDKADGVVDKNIRLQAMEGGNGNQYYYIVVELMDCLAVVVAREEDM